MKHVVDIGKDAKIVMYGLYCIHICHLRLLCGFTKNFPAITWRVLVKSKQIVCISHLIITWRNKNSVLKIYNKNCGWYLFRFYYV